MKKEIFKISEKELENIAGGEVLTPEAAGVSVVMTGGRSLGDQDVRNAINEDPTRAAGAAGQFADCAATAALAISGAIGLVVSTTTGVVGWVIGRKSGKAKAEKEMTKSIVLSSLCTSRRV